jgi:hypothetical protein
MFFDLTGAAVASAASGNEWWHIVTPLAVALVLVASWALWPPNRTLGAIFPKKRPTFNRPLQTDTRRIRAGWSDRAGGLQGQRAESFRKFRVSS